MSCQKCGSDRLFRFYAKHNDLFVYTYKDQKEVNDYAPHIDNLCGGDDTQATICLECGQVQGDWPVEFEGAENEFDEMTDEELAEEDSAEAENERQRREDAEFERQYNLRHGIK